MRHVFLSILIYIYSFLIEFLGFSLFLLSTLINKKNSWHIKERRSLPPLSDDSNKGVVWIHAASLGEAKILVKVLSILQKKYSDARCVLTAVTESGVNFLRQQKIDSVCAVGFLPLDTLFLMNKMIKDYAVSRVWLIETEIWPAMLWACFNNNIPVGIINARMEERSFKLYNSFLWMLNPFFSIMDVVLAQDQNYALRFMALGVSQDSVHLIGNIKSSISIDLPPTEKRGLIRRNLNLNSDDVAITIGCLHPDETGVLNKTIEILKSRGYTWKWVIVPRHLNKSQTIMEKLGNGAVLTKDIFLSSEWEMCIINKFGVLEDMYMIADAAVIGGTFNTTGGHNIWEAVQYTIPVFFGPDYHTQQESCKRVLDAGVGFCVKDAGELAEGLIAVISNNKESFLSKMMTLKETMNREISSLEAYL